MRKAILLPVLLLALSSAAAADVPRPMAAMLPAAPLASVDVLSFGPLDRGWLAWDDARSEEQGLPPRFAVPQEVHLTPWTDGTWEELPGGLWLWRLRIRAEEAASLNLGFTRFRLPAGARLQIYSADLIHLVRPFTAEDNEEHGELWTPVVPTDDLVVELAVPAAVRSETELEIGQVGQGYRGFGVPGSEKSGSCNMDVECLDGDDPWRQTARATAVISRGGSTNCSGSLVNNTARDRRMFFVTAQHCGVNSSNAASLVVYWNYQNSTCRTPGSVASGGAGDGQRSQFHTGSFFRAENSASDFTLVELDDPAVEAYDHHWAGWDRSAGDVSCSEGTCYECSETSLCAGIHHPSTHEKRITFVEQTITPSGFGIPGNTHLWAHWDPTPVFPPIPGLTIPPQVTEPGSSGSPLYNKDRRFIGQLHGGPSACGATGDDLSDFYGRFSVSWSAAAAHLDPGNTGELFIDGVDFLDNLIFADGFESGTTGEWSQTVP
jgi:lysyl endopeptidase